MTFAIFSSNAVSSLIAILVLALVHLLVKELKRLSTSSRHALLALGAGASLAYVLLRILPKLAEKQEDLMASVGTGVRGFLEHHAYLVAMTGLVVYYGISRLASHRAGETSSDSSSPNKAVLIGTVAGYGAYSMLIGYLIVNRLQFGLFSMTLITLGMGTLFLVSDYGLYKRWPSAYSSWIRWVLTLTLLSGWALGVLIKVSSNVVALWYAFLAGVMLIVTIGEKLSNEEPGSFWPFLAGVLIFTALLLALEQMPQTPL